MLRLVVNSFTKAGRVANEQLRRDWKWHVTRLRARRAGAPVQCRMLGGAVTAFADPDDAAIGRSLFITGEWEPAETRFIKRVVRQGMVVFDIGANIGPHTLLLASCVGPSGTVHAFEPTRAADFLALSLQANGLTHVALNRVALGEAPGTAHMRLMQHGAELFASFGEPMYSAAAIGYVEVPVDTVDGYIQRNGIRHVDFAKMDVEGAELLVLHGARHALESQIVGIWLFEINDHCLRSLGHSPEELEACFLDAGYRLLLLDEAGEPKQFDARLVQKNRDLIAIASGARDIL